jgi:hypothetical protein
MKGMRGRWRPVTGRTIFCAFKVANALGHGFVAKVDDNARITAQT